MNNLSVSVRRFSNILRKIAVTVTFFIFYVGYNSYAAIYYVDYNNGRDSNSGLSSSSAFKHCPGDPNASEKSGMVSLVGGDIVKFKGGVIYNGKILTKWNGASEISRIIYDGNSTEEWGSGRAIVSGELRYDTGFSIISVSNITIKSFEITKQGRGLGIRVENGSNIIVEDCYIHRIFDWNNSINTNPKGSDMQANGGGIRIDGKSSNVTIDGCEITRTGGQGIGIKGSSKKVEVKNCKIHDYIIWFIDIAPLANQTISDIYIHDNEIYNMYHYSSVYWSGAIKDEKVNYSTYPNPHQDGIFIRNPLNGTLSNIQIYNNNFYNDIVLSGTGGTAQIFTSETRMNDSIFIYNNTFQNPYPYVSIAIGWLRHGKIHIYNNTFHTSKSALQISVYHDWGTPTAEVHLKNNIFNMLGNGIALKVFAQRGSTIEEVFSRIYSDYNLFKVSKFLAAGDCGYIKSLDEWKAKSGRDSKSIEAADVKFNAPKDPPLCSKSDLSLSQGSPAIDSGIALSSYFSISQGGTKRPQGTGWDIGAFEKSSGSTNTSENAKDSPIEIPKNLKILN